MRVTALRVLASLGLVVAVTALSPAHPAVAMSAVPTPRAATCTDTVGPSIPPPPAASLVGGLPGYRAQFYGQSGYPVLCPMLLLSRERVRGLARGAAALLVPLSR